MVAANTLANHNADSRQHGTGVVGIRLGLRQARAMGDPPAPWLHTQARLQQRQAYHDAQADLPPVAAESLQGPVFRAAHHRSVPQHRVWHRLLGVAAQPIPQQLLRLPLHQGPHKRVCGPAAHVEHSALATAQAQERDAFLRGEHLRPLPAHIRHGEGYQAQRHSRPVGGSENEIHVEEQK